MTDTIPILEDRHDKVIDDLLECFAEYGDHDRGAMSYVLDEHFSDLARKAAKAERLAEVLKIADNALCNHACHCGNDAPCIRTKQQCADDCGKIAGNAVIAIRQALSEWGEQA